MRELDDGQKTPPAVPTDPVDVIVTAKDVTVIRKGARTIVSMAMPFVPKFAVSVGAALVAWMLSVSHANDNQKETEAKVEVAEKTTDRAFKGVVNPANEITAALNAALDRIKALETTTAAQSAVIEGFTVVGRPSRRRRRVDPGLVKIVRENAAADSKELAARKANPAPVLKPIPLEIPPAPPKDEHTAEAPKQPTPPAQSAAPVNTSPAPTPSAAP